MNKSEHQIECRRCARKPKKHKTVPNEPFMPYAENIIAFVNSKSGGHAGPLIIEKLVKYLGNNKVYDLSQGGPKHGLDEHRNVDDLRVIACGGDGTANWVMSAIDEMQTENKPALAIIPLGTGNDLSGALGWGYNYSNQSMKKMLKKVKYGQKLEFDRWSVTSKPKIDHEVDTIEDASSAKSLNAVFNNYFTFGTDAKVSLNFHLAREKNPDAFNTRFINQISYMKNYAEDFFFHQGCKHMYQKISVFECDGVSKLEKIKKHKYSSILILNIPSYSVGTNPWNTSKEGYEPQSFCDQKLEVIGFHSSDLMWIRMGKPGSCIAQASRIRIVTESWLPVKVDGEPSMLQPSEIVIEHKSKARMITAIQQKLDDES